MLTGWIWTRLPGPNSQMTRHEYQPKNPLELRVAFAFALVFVVMLAATDLAVTYLGSTGIYSLAVLMGLADVDPFIMSMTQLAGKTSPLSLAAASILVATCSNNVAKGLYAYFWSDRKTGKQSLGLLLSLATASLIPLLWIVD